MPSSCLQQPIWAARGGTGGRFASTRQGILRQNIAHTCLCSRETLKLCCVEAFMSAELRHSLLLCHISGGMDSCARTPAIALSQTGGSCSESRKGQRSSHCCDSHISRPIHRRLGGHSASVCPQIPLGSLTTSSTKSTSRPWHGSGPHVRCAEDRRSYSYEHSGAFLRSPERVRSVSSGPDRFDQCSLCADLGTFGVAALS